MRPFYPDFLKISRKSVKVLSSNSILIFPRIEIIRQSRFQSQRLQPSLCFWVNTLLTFTERNTSSFIRTQAKNLVKKINFLVCFTHCVSFLFSLFQNHDRKESVRNRTRAMDCAKKIVFPRTVRSCVKTPILAVSALRP